MQAVIGQQSSTSTSAEGGCGTAPQIHIDSISSLASFDRLANIIASLIPHLCRLAHGLASREGRAPARPHEPGGPRSCATAATTPGGSRSCATATVTDAQERVPPVLVPGPWEVTFLNGRGAPSAPVTFDALMPWNEHAEDGIRYYSGSAIYRKTIPDLRTSPTERLVLDLGDVKNIATVTVNGKTFPALWKPPYRVDITEAPRGTSFCSSATGTCPAAPLTLEIKVTNLWPNRLIGDDALPCDVEYRARKDQKNKGGIIAIPRRVWEGKPSPTGRHTFTTWRLWKKSDKLLPSGLIGPVRLLH